MKPNNLALIAETMQTNIKESAGNSADIASFYTLNTNLLTKIYPDTLVSQIASIQPSRSPVCKIAALYSSYSGTGSNNADDVHYGNSLIITVSEADAALLDLGGVYAVSGDVVADFRVIYKEKILDQIAPSGAPLSDPQYGLVQVLISLNGYTQSQWEDGTLLNVVYVGNTIGGAAIISYTRNRTAFKKIYFNYGLYTTGVGEIISPNFTSFETKTVSLEAKSRKTKTPITYEKLGDLISLYSEKAIDGILESISNQIKQEIDYEVINYLKDIAAPYNDVVINIPLSASLGMQNQLGAVTDDLFVAIFLMIEQIVKDTKRNRTMFVLADSFTASFLQLNPLHIKADPDENNPLRVGRIGAYPLFVDQYSTDNYILVGYCYDGKTPGDAGLLYAPYVHEIIEIDDAHDMFRKNLLAISRYTFTRHPQDTGSGIGDSDFFKLCQIDFRNIQNLSKF